MDWASLHWVKIQKLVLRRVIILLGDAFVNDGPEIRQENKRYGMEVEFDTVNNVFNISSGTTGEALAAGSVVGVDLAQNASSVAVGRYNLTTSGTRYQPILPIMHLIKLVMVEIRSWVFPRDGVEGYT